MSVELSNTDRHFLRFAKAGNHLREFITQALFWSGIVAVSGFVIGFLFGVPKLKGEEA